MNKTHRFLEWLTAKNHWNPLVMAAKHRWLDSVVPSETTFEGEPCLVWKAVRTPNGDPQVWFDGHERGAFTWLMRYFLPDQYEKMERHRGTSRRAWRRCDERRCVSPYHRWNIRDFAANRKFTDAQVLAIRADDRVGAVIAAEYGVGANTINKIRAGYSYKHIGGRITPPINRTRFKPSLDAETVRAIRAAEGSQRAVAAAFGIGPTQVRDIRARRTYRWVD